MAGERSPNENWDMEQVFEGGPSGAAFNEASGRWRDRADALLAEARSAPSIDDDPAPWGSLLQAFDEALGDVQQGYTFASCWACAYTRDPEAQRADVKMGAIWNQLELVRVELNDAIAAASDEGLAALSALAPSLTPYLEDTRRRASIRLDGPRESLAVALGRDGIQAWDRLYRKVSGSLEVRVGDRICSPGQASNLLSSNDRGQREAADAALAAAWSDASPLCVSALNHIVGVRQTLQDLRGTDELTEPLATCRMERATLEAMFTAVEDAREDLKRYLALKAEALGIERVSWFDLSAPIGALEAHDWVASSRFVEANFRAVMPEMADFARGAFEGAWIEAEDRPNKRQGAWCAWLPRSRQSRIFMTHGGTFRSTITLAHELGHAFHNHAMQDLSPLQRRVPMPLAETASIFAESLVRDAALEAASTRAARLALYDARLQAAVTFLMNIPARFTFERRLYALRRTGEFSPAQLCEEMVRAQREAYCGALSSWDPWFWASKLHFYMGQRAFYNFPYTFGYLFAGLVYQRARAEGPAFRDTLIALLRRSAWDRAEPMTLDLLGLDLTDPDTWRQALATITTDLTGLEAALREG